MSRPLSSAVAAGMRGFTLIEMLVVMVLLGLLTGLALPAMQRWHDGVQARANATSVVEALRGAAFASGAGRVDLLMDEESFTPAPSPGAASSASTAAAPASAPAVRQAMRRVAVTLPHQWEVQRVVPAVFLSNGLCRPGLVALKTERGAALVIQVGGPVCAIELAPASAAGS